MDQHAEYRHLVTGGPGDPIVANGADVHFLAAFGS